MAEVEVQTQTRAAAEVAHDTLMRAYGTRFNPLTGAVDTFPRNLTPITTDYATARGILGDGAARPSFARALMSMQDYLQGRHDYAAMRCEVRFMISHLAQCGLSQRAASDFLEEVWGKVEQAHKADTGYIN